MEACGSAHYWGRISQGYGHQVKVLPAQHVRAYVRRGKTDAADAAGLLDASRRKQGSFDQTGRTPGCSALHRLRTELQQARTARINSVRGLLR